MNSTCKKIRKRLSAFSDGELKPGKRSAVERHLSACPDCRREFEAASRAWSLLDGFETVESRENFEAEFWRIIGESGIRRPLWLRVVKALPVSALAFLCLVLGIVSGFYLGKVIFRNGETAVSFNVSLPEDSNFPYLDNFADFPKDSVAGAYIAVASQSVNSAKGGSK
jgi:predicted anti-sigma-YlaC factor YlaD